MTRYARSEDRYKRSSPTSVIMGPHDPTGWTDWMDQPLRRVFGSYWQFGVNQHGFWSMPSLYENGAPFPGQALFDASMADAKTAPGELQYSGTHFSPGIINGASYGFGFDPDPGNFFADESDHWLTTYLVGVEGNATQPGILLPETPVPPEYVAYELEGSTAVQVGGDIHYRRNVNVSHRRRVDQGFAYAEEMWREAYGREAHLQLLLGDSNDLPSGGITNVAGYDWQSNRPSGVGGTVIVSTPLVEYPNEASGVDPEWTTQASILASPSYEWTGGEGKLFIQRVAPPDEDIPFQNLATPGFGNPHSVNHSSYEGEQHAEFLIAARAHFQHPRVRFLVSGARRSTTATPVSTRFHRF